MWSIGFVKKKHDFSNFFFSKLEGGATISGIEILKHPFSLSDQPLVMAKAATAWGLIMQMS